MHGALIHFGQIVGNGLILQTRAGELDMEVEFLILVQIGRIYGQLGHGQIAVTEAVGEYGNRCFTADNHRSFSINSSAAVAMRAYNASSPLL